MKPGDAPSQRYRIWIAGYDDWQPTDWQDVPPRAIALEPAETFVLSAAQALSFLEGFNSQMLNRQMLNKEMPHGEMLHGEPPHGKSLRGQTLDGAKRLWAVAVPVSLHYEGDPLPGETVVGHRF